MKRLRFVTYFQFPLEPFHLAKDVGVIPYLLGTRHGFETQLIGASRFPSESLGHPSVPGVSVRSLGRSFILSRLRFLAFLLRHARRIDVLNLYFLSAETFIWTLAYKSLNPGGIAYVKTDWGGPPLQRSSARTWIRNRAWSYFVRRVDLVSAESQTAIQQIEGLLSDFRGKLKLVPNGFRDDLMAPLAPQPPKERLMLTVGRIGLPEKNHPALLEALTRVDLKGWTFAFIGPIEQGFREVVDRWRGRNPHLATSVLFTGEISDPQELYRWYQRSQLCCLPSIQESFGLVLPEALAFGNRLLVSTRVLSGSDLTDQGRLGEVVEPSAEALADALERFIARGELGDSSKGDPHHVQRYSWTRIVQDLSRRLSV